MTLEEALKGKTIPKDIRDTLVILDISYLSFAGEEKTGQLVIHRSVEDEVKRIFTELLAQRFPVMKMIPAVFYNWEDDRSMEDNNTSAFNYRTIADTDRLSNHSYGLAIDINPVQNPYIKQNGTILPKGATYDPTKPGTVTPEIADILISRGWKWGGNWTDPKDWQHFEKPFK